jgi:hypothetical protein
VLGNAVGSSCDDFGGFGNDLPWVFFRCTVEMCCMENLEVPM